MSDNASSDPSDDESDTFSDDDSDTSESDDNFDPPEVFVYMGKGGIPRNVRRAEVDRSVKFIPECLFKNCNQLESVLLHEGLLGIGWDAFLGCSSLRVIHIPSTVTEIRRGAFWGCSNLAAVELPEGLESVMYWTFCECTSLEAVRIPASVAWIGLEAFEGCTNLRLVELPQGVRMIMDGAFSGCWSLGSLRVPSSVNEIGEEAFSDCGSLALVQLSEDLPKMERFAFWGCPLESFRFVPLSDRMEAIRMDDQAKSMFDGRLSEITRALTGEEYNEMRVWSNEEKEEADAIWDKCKESLGRAKKVLTYFELKGAAPALEMALWKATVEGKGGEGAQRMLGDNEDGRQDLSDTGRERKRPKVKKNIGQDTRLSREDCRIKCGAGIVFPEVLKFFTYRSNWPQLDGSE